MSYKITVWLLLAALALALLAGCVSPSEVIIMVTPTPAQTPTPVPTDAPIYLPTAQQSEASTPTPVPADTPLPSSFLFGGQVVEKGQTTVRVRGQKNAIIRISAEETNLLISLCPNLTSLILDYCCMPDYSRIGELTALRNLQISTTTHEEDYGNPLKNIDWISSLCNLQTLTLCYNEIDDIRAIADLTELTELNLAWNDLTDDDLEWLKESELRTLYLYGNSELCDVSGLASIRSLEMLHLGGCTKISDIRELALLPNLKELDISCCQIRDFTCFRNFQELKTIRLEYSEYVDFYFYYDLAQCETLRKIIISEEDKEIEKALKGMIADTGRSDIEIVYWETYRG